MVMVEFLSGPKHSDNARAVLLKYYSTKCITHGAYIITVALALWAFIWALPYFWSIEVFTRVVLLGFISSILLILTVHILGRTFFWNCSASAVLHVVPKKEGEIKTEEGTTATSLLLLHQACVEYVRRKHRVIGEFYKAQIWEIELWLIFLIGLSLIWLALNL